MVFIANQNINKMDLFHLNYHVIINNETDVYDQLHNVCSTKFRINWSSWQQPVAAVEGRLKNISLEVSHHSHITKVLLSKLKLFSNF